MVANSSRRRWKGKKRETYEIVEPKIKSQERRKMHRVGMGSAKKNVVQEGALGLHYFKNPWPISLKYNNIRFRNFICGIFSTTINNYEKYVKLWRKKNKW